MGQPYGIGKKWEFSTDTGELGANIISTFYEGEIKNGEYDGRGRLVFASGSFYEGDF